MAGCTCTRDQGGYSRVPQTKRVVFVPFKTLKKMMCCFNMCVRACVLSCVEIRRYSSTGIQLVCESPR